MQHGWVSDGGGGKLYHMRAKDAYLPEPAPWHTWVSRDKPDFEGRLAPAHIRLSPMSSVEDTSEVREDYRWKCPRCGSMVVTNLSNSPTPVEVHASGVDLDCNGAVVDTVHRL